MVLGLLISACHLCAKKKLLWFKNKSKLPTAASEPHLAFYHRKPTTAVKAVKNPAGSHYLKKSPSPTGSKTPVVRPIVNFIKNFKFVNLYGNIYILILNFQG